MKNFKIPVYWNMCTDVSVQANSLQEALDTVQLQWSELPLDGEYIDDSFEVNHQYANEMNDDQGVLPNYA